MLNSCNVLPGRKNIFEVSMEPCYIALRYLQRGHPGGSNDAQIASCAGLVYGWYLT